MTIQEALDRIDAVKPNMVPTEIKIQWLGELDGMIWKEIITQHEPADRDHPVPERWWKGRLLDPLQHDDVHHFPPPPPRPMPDAPDEMHYALDIDTSTRLLVPFPYDRMYQFYLAMKIDEVNMEIEKRNNDGALFDAAYGEYSDWYTRHHMPLQKRRSFRL